MTMLAAESFFDLAAFEHRGLWDGSVFVWEGLGRLKSFMDNQDYPTLPNWLSLNSPLPETVILWDGSWMAVKNCKITYGDATKGGLKVEKDGQILEGASVIMAGAVLQGERFLIGEGVLIESGALVQAPAMIGKRSVVRQGAYMRGYCLVGQECVVGHVTEVKHSIFLNGAKAGHFAYVGDSILGSEVNLGAGTKLANLRFVGGEVSIVTSEGSQGTGLRKLGAILGDAVQTGCNSVTNPGTLLGMNSIAMPCVMVPSGYHAASTIIRG